MLHILVQFEDKMLLSKKNLLGLRNNLKIAKIVARFEFF